jgi:hypothetical protein
MSLPLIEITTDKHGLPALRLTGEVTLVVPLARSSAHPLTMEMVVTLPDQLQTDYGSELPETWSTQAAWDNVIQLKTGTTEMDRAARFALSLYGWLAGASLAGAEPAQWLANQLPPIERLPGQTTETIWTVLEGRPDDELRLIGAVADQPHGQQAWEIMDQNQPLGVRGGHQEIWMNDLPTDLTTAIERLAKVAVPAIWLRPKSTPDWPKLAAVLKPAVVVDPYPLRAESDWRRLKLELTGRRLATTVWASDGLLEGEALPTDLLHGICWLPTRYRTLSDFLATWREAAAKGWRSMLVEPETATDAAWLTDLAAAIGADYVWRGRA